MKRIIPIMLGVLCLCECKNAPQSNSFTENEYRQMLQESGMIAIPATFIPTLDLTDEIRESSLEDLIIQNKGKYSAFEEKKREVYINKRVEDERQRAFSEGREFTEQDEKLIRIVEANSERPISPLEMAMYSDVTLKHLPQTSNIAKIFYMDKKESFILFNQDFYCRVMRKQLSSQQEDREKAAQEKWKEYD